MVILSAEIKIELLLIKHFLTEFHFYWKLIKCLSVNISRKKRGWTDKTILNWFRFFNFPPWTFTSNGASCRLCIIIFYNIFQSNIWFYSTVRSSERNMSWTFGIYFNDFTQWTLAYFYCSVAQQIIWFWFS
jgi:hypothetical protein